MTAKIEKRYSWDHESGILVSIALAIAGFMLEMIKVNPVNGILRWPDTLIVGVSLFLLIFLISIIGYKKNIFNWLRSPSATFSSILLFTFFAILIGIIPQHTDTDSALIKGLRLNSILNTWYFMFSTIYLLFILGTVTFYKIMKFKSTKISFIINHLGLWFVVLGMSIGSGDRTELFMSVDEEQDFIWYAYDENQEVVEVPFAIKLNDFKLTEYPPKIALIQNESQKIVGKGINAPQLALRGSVVEFEKYRLKVLQVLEDVVSVNDTFRKINMPGAVYACQIEIHDKISEAHSIEWLTTGNRTFPAEFKKLDNEHSLVLLNPQVKRYESIVQFHTPDGKQGNSTIEVNKPLELNGWKIYQNSYDSNLGKWSPVSTLQLVYDPWKKLVYIGFLMILAGSFLMIVQRRKN